MFGRDLHGTPLLAYRTRECTTGFVGWSDLVDWQCSAEERSSSRVWMMTKLIVYSTTFYTKNIIIIMITK